MARIILQLKEKKERELREVKKGSLFRHGDTIGFVSEYSDNNGRIDAYILGSGEFFWGDTSNPVEQSKLKVIPLEYTPL